MNTQEIIDLEENIQAAKEIVALGEALERLATNRDFRAVISDGYFRDEAIRLVHLKSDPSVQSEEAQKSILSQMDAIGSLNQYFRMIQHRADLARRSIEEDERTIEELTQEGEE